MYFNVWSYIQITLTMKFIKIIFFISKDSYLSFTIHRNMIEKSWMNVLMFTLLALFQRGN